MHDPNRDKLTLGLQRRSVGPGLRKGEGGEEEEAVQERRGREGGPPVGGCGGWSVASPHEGRKGGAALGEGKKGQAWREQERQR